MWQPSHEDKASSIPPNLLKNFNAYEILEPQRSQSEPNVDNLIDFDDDSKSSTLNSEIINSFADTTNDCGLIDLFQNIFVTPQQVKTVESKRENDEIERGHIDYSEFFDKLESGDKFNWSDSQNAKDDPTTPNITDINKGFNIKPKVLVGIDLDPDSDREDAADEDSDFDDHHEELIDQLIASKTIEKQILSQMYNSQPSTSKALTSTEPSKEIIKKPDNINIEPEIKEHPRSTELLHEKGQNSDDDFVVRAMIKDDKAYRRNRVVHSEREKLNYTKGPDFNEKQIVLPQIMRRLYERKRIVEEDKCWKRRLILDSGKESSTASCPNSSASNSNFNVPVKLLQQTSLKTASASAKVYSSKMNNSNLSTTKSYGFSTVRDKSLTSSTRSVKPNLSQIAATSKTILNSTAVSNSLTDSAADVSSKSSNICTNIFSKSNDIGSSSDDWPLGAVRPFVLMEDCNKERLLAWERSQRIYNLVRTGKLYP